MNTAEMVSSLRQLADWYEKHPNLPLPHELQSPMFVFLFGESDERVTDILREIGSFEKVFDEPSPGDFHALKMVGSIGLKFHTSRDQVCTRRVVGTRIIPKKVVPQQVIEAYEEEIVEWDCEPVLAGKGQ